MDSTLIDILKWIIPMIIAGASSFFGIKYGLKNLEEKVEDNRKSIADRLDESKKALVEKIDKIDLKLEKMSEQQIKTDKELVLVEHRVKQMEQEHDEFEDTIKELVSKIDRLKFFLDQKNIHID